MVKTFRTKGGSLWLRVDHTFPCPICGKTDWCCVNENQTKAVCMRQIDNTKPSYMGGTLYDLKNYQKVNVKTLVVNQGEKLARANVLHKVYSLVIQTLGLSDEHLYQLMNRRGLSREQIQLRGYASGQPENLRKQIESSKKVKNSPVPQITTVWEKLFLANGLEKDAWKGVPGFYFSEKQQVPIFETQSGLLIPWRNEWGQIVGMQVRVDDDKRYYSASFDSSYRNQYRVSIQNVAEGFKYKVYRLPEFEVFAEGVTKETEVSLNSGFHFTIKSSPKYLYVSSGNKPMGTSGNSVPHYAFPDEILAQARFDNYGNSRVYLMNKIDNIIMTEGLLKGDIVASLAPESRLNKLGSVLVMAMAGVSSWKYVAKDIVKHGFTTAYLAYDQDFADNDAVYKSLSDCCDYLARKNGVLTRIMQWDFGKGLDDYLLSPKSETEEIHLWRANMD
ncbi:hypothetical protein GPZ88_09960 (plasmid) [Streptococcus ruminicola]|uniref:DUF3854 domain-containing protein n=1 Tax=Streptococcus ruminicola TaxID=2686210 RepID=A0A6G8I2N3_9STRE|nr:MULTISPECIES: hypothetical protein [Streptococcus]QGX47343.1 hypothetical protein GPA00_09415 [Streptococcus equinus]QIM47392.1 hypothetical protein GPZ88_09960 [Streptococcus ruminicola]